METFLFGQERGEIHGFVCVFFVFLYKAIRYTLQLTWTLPIVDVRRLLCSKHWQFSGSTLVRGW